MRATLPTVRQGADRLLPWELPPPVCDRLSSGVFKPNIPGHPRHPAPGHITPAAAPASAPTRSASCAGARQRNWHCVFIDFALERARALGTTVPAPPADPPPTPLRRHPSARLLPLRRSRWQARAEAHRAYTSDDLTTRLSTLHLARNFTYQPRWTARHFGIQRDLVKALCLDSGDELRAAWREINAHGGAAQQPAALELLLRLPSTPQPVTWRTAIGDYYSSASRIDYIARWTARCAQLPAARLA